MRKPGISPSTRACVHQIQALRINAAARAQAQAEFERAEASTDALVAIVQQYRHALSALQRQFTVRRQRHG